VLRDEARDFSDCRDRNVPPLFFKMTFSALKNFKLAPGLRAACEVHQKDHQVIHVTHEHSFHLPPTISTVDEIEETLS
jgi:hypothetical protein